jgi:preprotein translocase subunit SecG
MEYLCVGVIFFLAAIFAVLGLVFMLQYRSRTKDPSKDAESISPSKNAKNEDKL